MRQEQTTPAGARTQVNEGTIGREAIQCCDPDTDAHGTFLYTGADHNESGSRVSPIFSNYGDLCAWCKVNGWSEEAGVRIYHKDKDQGKVGVGYDPAGRIILAHNPEKCPVEQDAFGAARAISEKQVCDLQDENQRLRASNAQLLKAPDVGESSLLDIVKFARSAMLRIPDRDDVENFVLQEANLAIAKAGDRERVLAGLLEGESKAEEEPEIRTFSEATGVTTTFDDLPRKISVLDASNHILNGLRAVTRVLDGQRQAKAKVGGEWNDGYAAAMQDSVQSINSFMEEIDGDPIPTEMPPDMTDNVIHSSRMRIPGA